MATTSMLTFLVPVWGRLVSGLSEMELLQYLGPLTNRGFTILIQLKKK